MNPKFKKNGRYKKKRVSKIITIKAQESAVRNARKWLKKIKQWEAEFQNPQYIKKHPEHRPETLPAIKKLAKEHLAKHAKLLADLKNKEAIKKFEETGEL